MIQRTLIDWHPNEYSQEFHNYTLDRCVGSCNTLNDLSNKIQVTNKTEDLNLSFFSMITGISEWGTLTKHVACECKCRFDGGKCNSDQWWNYNKCRCELRNIIYMKNIMFRILLHVVVKMVNI